MNGTIDLNQLVVFVRVIQAGSLSEAARRMDLPKSTVSRKISDLEERVGERLIQRTTRKLSLTEAGRVLFERVGPAMSDIEEAESAVAGMRGTPRGVLRIAVPMSSSTLGPIVAEYLVRHPEVAVEMVCSDRLVDLVEERFDVAIRAGALVDSTLVARNLGTAKSMLVVAPEYSKRHGVPKTPAELTSHACVAFGGGATPHVWTLESRGKRVEVRIRPRLTVNDMEIARESALAGVGIACLPELFCADDVRSKRLLHLLADWSFAQIPVHALYPTRRHLSPKVVAFVDLLAARIRLDDDARLSRPRS
ncbi:LysR family transcriptional regulator [Burkholderia pyrrocinia]|uniref:LysR family transcriptional regulator n=1 Tax=Burkholderia TaxID=32008 RepID=UPI0009DD18EF|nr:LysR family transcriptional regulator [Burkholderia pyrrocinia]EKS9887498.1 LysR family transcriptional regulator [Burkholderia pyrrocinia]EKS9897941.1 LysR family transcriptional regulator [Burkholderia pyrrocinia]EKS9910806.1 LysR family transcriptional regulator [Burkholderia pyrrocinia]